MHCIVKIPDAWTSLPTFADCQALQAEIQLRTIAQHTWAEASHLLQYKHESSVPFEVRRSINRVAALLETVDLEFERVLSERDSYIAAILIEPNATEPLNVDTLKAILDARLPDANRSDHEDYADLEKYLKENGIETAKQLHGIIDALDGVGKLSEPSLRPSTGLGRILRVAFKRNHHLRKSNMSHEHSLLSSFRRISTQNGDSAVKFESIS